MSLPDRIIFTVKFNDTTNWESQKVQINVQLKGKEVATYVAKIQIRTAKDMEIQ